jgi:hypothetical protein
MAAEEEVTMSRHSGATQSVAPESGEDDCWIPGSSLRDAPE